MDELKYVTYCGLYCKLCAEISRIPKQAKELYESMEKEGYNFWGNDIPGFTEFWKFLESLKNSGKACRGCRDGGGYPFCEIRQCAMSKKLDCCTFCEEYPCAKIINLAKTYPNLMEDGKRMKQIGLKAWIKDQEKRCATGFCYADIRYEKK